MRAHQVLHNGASRLVGSALFNTKVPYGRVAVTVEDITDTRHTAKRPPTNPIPDCVFAKVHAWSVDEEDKLALLRKLRSRSGHHTFIESMSLMSATP
jgi:hypothetical protein